MKSSKSAKKTPAKKAKTPKCWQFEKCPPKTRNECPAYPDHGTECWAIQGTLCDGGRFEHRLRTIKIMHCRNHCNFYKKHLKKHNG